MGLGDIVEKDVERGKQKESEEVKKEPDPNGVEVAGKSPKEIAEEIEKRLFLHEYVDELGVLVEAPEDKEWVSRGDIEIEEPLKEGYEDCTDRVEFVGTVTKYLDCPSCDNNLRQRSGSSARRGNTWTRCGGCGRILVDLKAGERDDSGNIIEQTGLGNW